MRGLSVIGVLATTEKFGSIACRVMQRFLVVLIFVLFFTFSYFYLSFLFSSMPHIESLSTSHKAGFLITGLILLYNLVYNYVMANRVGPGYMKNLPFSTLCRYVIPKRCKKCSVWKPVRTHHCSICDMCIMQMDHHCPWMGVCIGHHNRRYFIRFLTYLTLSCVLVVVLILRLQLPKTQIFMFMATISVVVGLFGAFHWVLMLCGRTTLEVCDILDNYKPSRSIATNFQIVFGTKNFALAMMPIYIPLTYEGCSWNQLQAYNHEIHNDESQSLN